METCPSLAAIAEMGRGSCSCGDANPKVGQLCTLPRVKILQIKIRGGGRGVVRKLLA